MKYKFKNMQLSYFKHPSCGSNPEFQRLEFLGDKVLSFFLSKWAYFNNFNEKIVLFLFCLSTTILNKQTLKSHDLIFFLILVFK